MRGYPREQLISIFFFLGLIFPPIPLRRVTQTICIFLIVKQSFSIIDWRKKEGRRKRNFVDVLYVILESLFAKVDVHSSSRFSAFFRNPLCLGLMAKAHLHNPRSHLHKDRPWKKTLHLLLLPLVWPSRFTTSEGTNWSSKSQQLTSKKQKKFYVFRFFW